MLSKPFAEACEQEIKTWKGYEKFKLSVAKFDESPRRKRSWGGKFKNGYGFSIAVRAYINYRTIPHLVNEYPSLNNDKEIGGFFYDPTNSPELHLLMTICHEMAHAAQFFAHDNGIVKIDRPHGTSFQIPYRKLRTSQFNHLIPPNQLELKNRWVKLQK